ncbi:MAG: RnfABCDGE type electron transport complex subunit D [Treponema sp.]|nr:RnfABCDGE type electron transport complex subunit D [Treponema sp.]
MPAKKVQAVLERGRFHEPQTSLARRPAAARMWIVSLCAFLVVIQSSLGDSFSSLLVAVCAVAAAVLTEALLLNGDKRAQSLKDGSAVACALILVILLPNQISPLYAAAGAAFAMAVVKHSFGGLGSNWLNPAAGGWLFVRFSWPASFQAALDGSHLAPLARFAGDSGYGYMDILASPFPGIIADRGVLALLAAAVIITALRINRVWIPLVYVAVFSLLVRLAGDAPHGWGGESVLFALGSGGTLAAAFFLVCDPATGAKSACGGALLAALAASLAVLFRFYGGEPYGAFFAVVFANALFPLVRVFERLKLYKRYS